jgi:hypothetical protein
MMEMNMLFIETYDINGSHEDSWLITLEDNGLVDAMSIPCSFVSKVDIVTFVNAVREAVISRNSLPSFNELVKIRDSLPIAD